MVSFSSSYQKAGDYDQRNCLFVLCIILSYTKHIMINQPLMKSLPSHTSQYVQLPYCSYQILLAQHFTPSATFKLQLCPVYDKLQRFKLRCINWICNVHPSSVCSRFIPFIGSRGFLLEPIPADSGRGQGTPWKSRQLIAGPFTDGRGHHASCQLHIRSNLGFSILLKDTSTCSSAQPSLGELGFEPATLRSLADLLQLSYSRPDFATIT